MAADMDGRAGAPRLPRSIERLLGSRPALMAMQPALKRIMHHLAHRHAGLFERAEAYRHKRFLIDPVNLPFALLLSPVPRQPRLRAVRRDERPAWDARMAGSFLTLLEMVDGKLDGDAMFFTGELQVEGDTEAVVALRNALDDVDASLADEAAALFGPAGCGALSLLRLLRDAHQARRHGHASHQS